MKKTIKKITAKMKRQQEAQARITILQELFEDFHTNRLQVYKMNFVRGISFGFGSVIGGTLVVALLVWFLAQLGGYIPVIGDTFEALSNTIENAKK